MPVIEESGPRLDARIEIGWPADLVLLVTVGPFDKEADRFLWSKLGEEGTEQDIGSLACREIAEGANPLRRRVGVAPGAGKLLDRRHGGADELARSRQDWCRGPGSIGRNKQERDVLVDLLRELARHMIVDSKVA